MCDQLQVFCSAAASMCHSSKAWQPRTLLRHVICALKLLGHGQAGIGHGSQGRAFPVAYELRSTLLLPGGPVLLPFPLLLLLLLPELVLVVPLPALDSLCQAASSHSLYRAPRRLQTLCACSRACFQHLQAVRNKLVTCAMMRSCVTSGLGWPYMS